MIKKVLTVADAVITRLATFDFVPLLAARLYMLPVVYKGAHSKIVGFSGTVDWFSTPASEGGLGMPFPVLMALLATAIEVLGVISLVLGLCCRVMTIPLMGIMSVASLMVHWSHGWLVIADKHMESTHRLNGLFEWLAANFPMRFNYVTELGDPVMLNNGMEFAVTYFVMLLFLLIFGPGRYVSADYWLRRRYLG